MTHTFADSKAAIPKDFENLVYPAASTTGSVSADSDSDQEQSKFLMLTSNDSTSAISKWYQEQLKSSAWKLDKVENADKMYSISGQKADQEINVNIVQDGAKANIMLSIGKQLKGSGEDKESTENFTPDKVTPPTD